MTIKEIRFANLSIERPLAVRALTYNCFGNCASVLVEMRKDAGGEGGRGMEGGDVCYGTSLNDVCTSTLGQFCRRTALISWVTKES